MTTDKVTSQSHLSTDLEILQARVKGQSLTLTELKQALKGRDSAMLLALLALAPEYPSPLFILHHHEIR